MQLPRSVRVDFQTEFGVWGIFISQRGKEEEEEKKEEVGVHNLLLLAAELEDK